MKLYSKNLKDSFIGENRYIFKKYKTLKHIGKGSFGNIYSVIRLKDKTTFAMKVEKINKNVSTLLESEAYYLFLLQEGIGIPKFITYGHIKNFNILIEELLDKSLYNIFSQNNIKCPILDLYAIAIQILERLEFIHSKGILYRDVKPQNFLIGIKDPNLIYIIDFGLCKKYRSSKTGKHIMPKHIGTLTGSFIYASPNVIRGKQPSRRDDLISLGYMLIYLLKRDLPWMHMFKYIKVLDKEKYYKLIELKETNGNGKLFNKIPNELVEYINYTRNLKFAQEPDYSFLRSLFKKHIISQMSLTQEKLIFNWNNLNPRNSKKRNNSKSNVNNRIYKKLKNNIAKRLKIENKSEINDTTDLKIHLNNSISSISFDTLEIVPNLIEKNYFKNRVNYINLKSEEISDNNINISLEKEKSKTIQNEELKKSTKNIIMKHKYNKTLLNQQNNKSSFINYKINNVINDNYPKKLIIENKITQNINNYNFIFDSNNLYKEKYSESYMNYRSFNYPNFKDNNLLSENLYKFCPFSNEINYKSPLLSDKSFLNNNLIDNNNENIIQIDSEKINDIYYKES